MPLYRTQVRLQMVSAVPEDAVTNTWWCIADDLAGLNLFLTQLGLFYQAIDGELSSAVATTGHIMKSYDMADPEPRAPVQVVTGTTLTPGTTSLPPELAVCLSFQAVQQSGTPQARRRGRVYIGPLRVAAIDSAGNVATTAATTIATAADALLTASKAASTWAWAVNSTVDLTAIEVDNGWVDQAIDVQRRRGKASPSRVLFS